MKPRPMTRTMLLQLRKYRRSTRPTPIAIIANMSTTYQEGDGLRVTSLGFFDGVGPVYFGLRRFDAGMGVERSRLDAGLNPTVSSPP